MNKYKNKQPIQLSHVTQQKAYPTVWIGFLVLTITSYSGCNSTYKIVTFERLQ